MKIMVSLSIYTVGIVQIRLIYYKITQEINLFLGITTEPSLVLTQILDGVVAVASDYV